MTRVGIYFAIFLIISVLAFNNCSGGKFEAISSIGNAALGSSQCLQKIRSAFKSTPLTNPSLCESPANYHCDLRRFRPEVTSSQNENRQCVSIAGMGETCVPVHVYEYNTSEQQKVAQAGDLVEGGAYNRDEVTCINTQITSFNAALIQADGDSVSQALEKTIEQCRQRSQL